MEIVPRYSGIPPRTLELRLSTGSFRDMYGNSVASEEFVRRWETSALSSSGSLKLMGQYPQPGETGVPTNARIQLFFDRTLPYVSSVDAVAILGRGERQTASFENADRVLVVNSATLSPNTLYQVSISDTALGLLGISPDSPIAFEFTTGPGPLLDAQADEITPPYSPTERFPINAKLVVRTSAPLPTFAPQVVTSSNPGAAISAMLLDDRRTLAMTVLDPVPSMSQVSVNFRDLRDILGRRVGTSGLSMRTGSELDREPPAIVGTTPSDGGSNVSPTTAIRVLLNERISLLTPQASLRLLKNGSVVDGKVSVGPRSYYDTAGNFVDFVPARPLDADSDYQLDIGGILDYAANASAAKTIRFRTGGTPSANPPYPRVIRTSAQFGEIGPQQTLEIEFDQPVSQAHSRATVELTVSRRSEGPLRYQFPLRLEFAANAIRVIPLASWPSNRTVSLSFSSQDLYGRDISTSFAFAAGRQSDTSQPVIVSVTPRPGSLFDGNTPIRVEFSKPMLAASQLGGGIMFSDSVQRGEARTEWSADLKSFTLDAPIPNYQDAYPSRISLAISQLLTDLGGNPIRTVTLVWPVVPKGSSVAPSSVSSVIRTWPQSASSLPGILSGFQPLQLLFNQAVNVQSLNRSLWVVNNVRMDGVWTAEGSLASFTPNVAWRPGEVGLLSFDQALSLEQSFRGIVPVSVESGSVARVVRASMSPSVQHPLDAVIEVEFDRDPPPRGAIQVIASPPAGFQQMFPVSISETRVRSGVMRYQPVNPLPLNGIVAIRTVEGSTAVAAFSTSYTNIVAAANQSTKVSYLSPAPGSGDVPRNAILSVLMDGGLNPITLESAVKVTVQGGTIPVLLNADTAANGALQITPQAAFPANALVTVKIDGWLDRAGRALPTVEWTFRTSQNFDFIAPRLLGSSTIVIDNTMLTVDPFVPVHLTFDKPLDPVRTLNAFRSSSNNRAIDWVLSADLRTITLTPPVLGWNRGERFEIRFACVDFSGNAFRTQVNFQIPFEPIAAPLELTSTSVQDGDTGLPLNVQFGLLFNQPPNGDAANQVFLKDSGGRRISLFRPYSVGRRLLLVPEVLLDPNSSYELTIGSVTGGTGRPLTNPRTIRFRSGADLDLTSPEATPRFGLADEPIVIRFSEPMNTAGLSETPLTWIDWRGGGSGFTVVAPVRADWASDRRTLTITPLQPLRNLEHKLNLGVVDLAGNGSDRVLGNFEYTFTPPLTLPAVPQTAVTLSPADGSTNVPLNARLLILLNVTAALPVQFRLYENGVLTEVSVDALTTSARISYPLQAGRQYRMEVAAFTDLYGRQYAAQSATFTAGTQQERSPLRFVSSTPTAGEAGVAIDRPWTLSFDKPLSPFFIYSRPQSSRNVPYSVRYEFEKEKLTARPSPTWPAAASIQWTVGVRGSFESSITDWAGNEMMQPVSLNFRTAALNDPNPPKLLSISPEPGTLLSAGPLAYITLRFSKPVDIPRDALQLFQGSTRAEPRLVYSADFTMLTISFLPAPDTRVTIIGSNAIRDNAENPLESFVIEYPTGGAVPYGYPSWRMTEPLDTLRASANTPVRLTFDRTMNVASAQGSIRVTENGQNVSGTLTASPDGKIFTFQSAMPYAAGATVRVAVLSTMRDPDGLPTLATTYGLDAATFFVMSPPAVLPAQPAAFAIARRGFHSTSPANGVLEVEFSQEVDTGSIQMDSVWLRHGSRLISGTPSLRDGRILRFEPSEPLSVGETYVLTAGSALRSVEGTSFPGQDLRFEATSPMQGTAEVDSVEAVDWAGRAAMRVRMSQPLSRLALPDGGTEAEVLPGVDAQEFLVIPKGVSAVTLSFERTVDAAGRRLPTKRKTIEVKR